MLLVVEARCREGRRQLHKSQTYIDFDYCIMIRFFVKIDESTQSIDESAQSKMMNQLNQYKHVNLPNPKIN